MIIALVLEHSLTHVNPYNRTTIPTKHLLDSQIDLISEKNLMTEGNDGLLEPQTGFTVRPKLDCPHYTEYLSSRDLIDNLARTLESLRVAGSIQGTCISCNEERENWMCLGCGEIFCSRFSNGHMVEHNTGTPTHRCALSFSDASVWCYDCDSYINSTAIRHLVQAFGCIKFPDSAETSVASVTAFKNLIDEAHIFANMEKSDENLEGSDATKSASVFDGMSEASHDVREIFTEFTREQLISGITNNSFRKGEHFTTKLPRFSTLPYHLHLNIMNSTFSHWCWY